MTAPSPLLARYLDRLVCPVCHGALALKGEEAIDCTACTRRYPIVDGLPVLIPGRATLPTSPHE